MRVDVLEITQGCFPIRTSGVKSDCYDLFLAEDVTLKKGEVFVAKLGVAMSLPKGMVARVYSRSSSPSKLNVSLANGVGFIDNSYSGDTDEWRAPLYAYKATTLTKGTRVCQFEIVPSQFATKWQKLKWLLSSRVRLARALYLCGDSRGGIGSTGK